MREVILKKTDIVQNLSEMFAKAKNGLIKTIITLNFYVILLQNIV